MYERSVYLAGKIDEGADSTFYRSKVAVRFREDGWSILDPLRCKAEIGPHSFTPSEIVQRDIQDVLRAHLVFAVIAFNEQGKRRFSFGTPCEIAIAWFNHIPVVLATDNSYLADHYWSLHLCSRVFLMDHISDAVDLAVDYSLDWYGYKSEAE